MFEWIPLFEWLSSSDKASLEAFCQERFYPKGSIVFHEWDDANAMYIVKSWLLEAYTSEKVLGYIHPGEIVGEMALFWWSNKKRTATVAVREDARLVVILEFSLYSLKEKYPHIFDFIQNTIAKRKQQNVG